MSASSEARRPERGHAGSGEYLLAVETSTTTSSVAIVSAEGVRVEITLGLTSSHSDSILGAIDHALAQASLGISDLAGLAVSAGPGSFTGLRIGLATVKGLAEAHPLPIVALSSLEVLAMNAPAGEMRVCPALDARKGEIYAALYAWEAEAAGWRTLIGEGAWSPDALAKKLHDAGGNVLLLGDGAVAYKAQLASTLGKRARFVPGPANQPRAAWVGWLGLDRLAEGRTEDPLTLVPRYLRQSEAELAWARRNPRA